MNRLLKRITAIMLTMAVVCMVGCKKTDHPNNGGNNGNNGGNGGETPETPVIVSTSEAKYDGIVYIEAVFDDETKMYFEILSPTEVALVNGEFYYQYNPSSAYMYRGEVVVPESIKHFGTSYSVVSISKKAFYSNDMVTSVYIPNSVVSILSYYTDMSFIRGAFHGCTNLNSIRMSDNIQEIGANAFYGCPCYEESVTIPKQVKDIGASAFSSKTVFFNADSCTLAGGFLTYTLLYTAFPDMNSICFGDNVKVLPSYLYTMTSFNTVEIPSSVSIIHDAAFYGCTSLSNVGIPNSVSFIGRDAFRDCISLTDITLPSSIKQIDDRTFFIYNNINLDTRITCMAIDPPTLGENVFYNRNVQVIFVPVSSVEMYKMADGWSQYADVIVGI